MKVKPSVKPICEKCKVIRRKGQLRWSWITLSKNGVLNIHMRYAHGEIIGKN